MPPLRLEEIAYQSAGGRVAGSERQRFPAQRDGFLVLAPDAEQVRPREQTARLPLLIVAPVLLARRSQRVPRALGAVGAV